MIRIFTLLFVATLLVGCSSVRNLISPTGEMGSSGTVNPCYGYRSNPQACGDAQYNAPRVKQLSLGKSIAEAKQIMAREPEERAVKIEVGQAIEIWGYLTDYDKSILSRITFTDGKITAIESFQR